MTEQRPYRYARWPTAERLQHEDGGKEMIGALMTWRTFNSPPTMCVANDNFRDDDEPAVEPLPHDLRMDTITAERVTALHRAGRSWRPDDERFDRPRRNDPTKSMPAGTFKANGEEYYQQQANAEDEAIRAADCKSARRRLGPICCRLVDLASGDSTTKEIAAAVKQPVSKRIETYVDWAIIRWMRDPAYGEYRAA